jgi:hypothetical protein
MALLGILIIALVVTLLFSPYRSRDSLLPLLVLFLVLFFAGYAAQLWIVPFGPVMWGVSWLPVLFVVLIFALLFSAPPAHRRAGGDEDMNATAVISIFIWLLLLILAGAIIFGLYHPNTYK